MAARVLKLVALVLSLTKHEEIQVSLTAANSFSVRIK